MLLICTISSSCVIEVKKPTLRFCFIRWSWEKSTFQELNRFESTLNNIKNCHLRTMASGRGGSARYYSPDTDPDTDPDETAAGTAMKTPMGLCYSPDGTAIQTWISQSPHPPLPPENTSAGRD